jgi:hypothetical protein
MWVVDVSRFRAGKRLNKSEGELRKIPSVEAGSTKARGIERCSETTVHHRAIGGLWEGALAEVIEGLQVSRSVSVGAVRREESPLQR